MAIIQKKKNRRKGTIWRRIRRLGHIVLEKKDACEVKKKRLDGHGKSGQKESCPPAVRR